MANDEPPFTDTEFQALHTGKTNSNAAKTAAATAKTTAAQAGWLMTRPSKLLRTSARPGSHSCPLPLCQSVLDQLDHHQPKATGMAALHQQNTTLCQQHTTDNTTMAALQSATHHGCGCFVPAIAPAKHHGHGCFAPASKTRPPWTTMDSFCQQHTADVVALEEENVNLMAGYTEVKCQRNQLGDMIKQGGGGHKTKAIAKQSQQSSGTARGGNGSDSSSWWW